MRQVPAGHDLQGVLAVSLGVGGVVVRVERGHVVPVRVQALVLPLHGIWRRGHIYNIYNYTHNYTFMLYSYHCAINDDIVCEIKGGKKFDHFANFIHRGMCM